LGAVAAINIQWYGKKSKKILRDREIKELRDRRKEFGGRNSGTDGKFPHFEDVGKRSVCPRVPVPEFPAESWILLLGEG
jgi:hypothetical protein